MLLKWFSIYVMLKWLIFFSGRNCQGQGRCLLVSCLFHKCSLTNDMYPFGLWPWGEGASFTRRLIKSSKQELIKEAILHMMRCQQALLAHTHGIQSMLYEECSLQHLPWKLGEWWWFNVASPHITLPVFNYMVINAWQGQIQSSKWLQSAMGDIPHWLTLANIF